MSFKIVDYGIVTTEPVTLAEAKAFMRIDADYASDDAQIGLSISSARERLELFLNVGLVDREIEVEWSGCPLSLPFSPNGEVVSVSDKDGVLSTDKYTINGNKFKTVYVGSYRSGDFNYFYSMNNSYVEITPINGAHVCELYTIKYNTGYEENLPSGLKKAILAETDYLYKLAGSPATDYVSPNAAALAAPFSKNLIL